MSIQRLLSMKKIFLITFIFLVSNLFAESWIFNRYGEKGKSDTPNFFILFSSKIEAGEWLSKSNRKLSDLRELEPLLGFLRNDMAVIAKSGFVLIECWENDNPGSENFSPYNYYVIP